MRFRVLFADGKTRDFKANQFQVCPDGSLILNWVKTSNIAGAPTDITFVRLIAAGLWQECEPLLGEDANGEDGTVVFRERAAEKPARRREN
jgi:hypothetical protein